MAEETLLHLWRTICDCSTPTSFFGMSQQQNVIEASEISARSSGTMERFILRIVSNTSTGVVKLDFMINGLVIPNSEIDTGGVGVTGTFLPISQLPLPFQQDDRLAIRISNVLGGGLVRAEMDCDLLFDPIPEVILPLKGYLIGHLSRTSTSIAWCSIGGEPSLNGVQAINEVPAMGSGLFKNIRTNITDFPVGGGNLRLFTVLNGINSAQLLPGIVGTNGTPTIHDRSGGDRAFVKDDIIGLRWQRSNGVGEMEWMTWMELEYEASELWFYSSRAFTQDSDNFLSIIDNSLNTVGVTPAEFGNRNIFQRHIGRDALIKDLVYYGTAPAGTGTTIIKLEVNGLSLPPDGWTSPDLAVSAGVSIQRFDDINVLVGENDLINAVINGRNGTALEGLIGIRAILL